MSSSFCLHSELTAVMESLVLAAVAGLKRLTDSEEAGRLDIDQHTMFASVMETLCNEALGKILSILEPGKVQLKQDKLTNRPSTKPHVLYILQDSTVGVEHSYGQPNTEQSDHCYGANNKKTGKGLPDLKVNQSQKGDSELLSPTDIKDKLGNISLQATVDGAEQCYKSSHKRRAENLAEADHLSRTAHRTSDTASEDNIQLVTESESGTPEFVYFDLDVIVNEMECANKAKHRKKKCTAQDNLLHREIEVTAQNEVQSQDERWAEPPSVPAIRIKSEHEESTLERAEEMCDSVTFSTTSYTSDLKSTTSGPQRWRFNCGICEIGYDSENAFRKHMCTHTGGKPFKCPSCDSSYYQSASLKRHMYQHTGERPFKCPECGEGFTDKDKLKGHMSVHTGQKAFPCNMCGKSFTAKTNLYRHMRSHSGVRPYICSECGRSYTRPETLKDHMTVHSSGIKTLKRTFPCSFCDRVFTQKANLMVHERIHTGERPYVCSLCSKAFRTSVSLRVHQRVHTGEKPYICDVCGRPFSQQSSLLVHKRVHLNERNYVCPTCSKSFNNPQNLKVHLRVHTGERPFVCGLCGKTFVQDAHLRIHKLHMHAGVKQCVCEHCGKAYADRRSLRLHRCVYK